MYKPIKDTDVSSEIISLLSEAGAVFIPILDQIKFEQMIPLFYTAPYIDSVPFDHTAMVTGKTWSVSTTMLWFNKSIHVGDVVFKLTRTTDNFIYAVWLTVESYEPPDGNYVTHRMNVSVKQAVLLQQLDESIITGSLAFAANKAIATGAYSFSTGEDAAVYNEDGTLNFDVTYELDNEVLLKAIFNSTGAYGKYSTSHSQLTLAYAPNSHTEGYKVLVTGTCGHGEGQETIVEAFAGHAEGRKTVVYCREYEGVLYDARYGHAEGYGTKSLGKQSHAQNAYTEAQGDNSDATGYKTIAKHKNSHTGGAWTITSAENQSVIGQYNADNPDALFIVGNGKEISKSSVKLEDVYTSGKYYYLDPDNKNKLTEINSLALAQSVTADSRVTKLQYRCNAVEVLKDGRVKSFESAKDPDDIPRLGDIPLVYLHHVKFSYDVNSIYYFQFYSSQHENISPKSLSDMLTLLRSNRVQCIYKIEETGEAYSGALFKFPNTAIFSGRLTDRLADAIPTSDYFHYIDLEDAYDRDLLALVSATFELI